MKPPADCFTVGILVGAVEGDATARFGSLLAYEEHRRGALAHGLIDNTDAPTAHGRDLYVRHRLDTLPPGRAYLWAPELLADVLGELNGAAS